MHINFDTINELKENGTIIYLDVDDYSDKYSGMYTIDAFEQTNILSPLAMECKLTLIEYNN